MEKGHRELRKNRLKNIVNSSFKFEYGFLANDIDYLINYQSKLEKLFSDSFYRNLERNFLRQYAKERISFSLKAQESNLTNFKRKLLRIISSTGREFEKTAEKRISLSSELQSNARMADDEKSSLESKSKTYSALSQDLSSSPRDYNYYNLISEIEDVERSIENSLHQFRVASDNISAIRNELGIMKTYENILKVTSQSSERMHNKVNRIESQLKQISLIYDSLGNNHPTKSLRDFLFSITGNVKSIKSVYIKGSNAIQQIVSDSENISIISEEQSEISQIFEEIKESTLRRSAELDTVLKFMMEEMN